MGFELKYTVGSLCAMEERLGGEWKDFGHRPFSDLRLLVWAGCLAERPEMTEEQCGSMIDGYLKDGHTVGELTDRCIGALVRSGFLKEADGNGHAI